MRLDVALPGQRLSGAADEIKRQQQKFRRKIVSLMGMNQNRRERKNADEGQ